MNKIRVGLVFGGQSNEHEISLMSARSVFNNINSDKYYLLPVGISREGYWLPPDRSREIITGNETAITTEKNDTGDIAHSLKNFISLDLDVVFPLLHGPFGEDGRIQGFLEMINIPYVGAGVLSSALGMDKGKMKEVFSLFNLPQTGYKVIYRDSYYQEDISDLIYPCFVKPANMGSSIGVSKVKEASGLDTALEEAFRYDNKVIVEENVEGREIECSVLGNTEIRASLPGEIKPKNEFYDYRAKYQDESTELIIPAPLEDNMVKEVQNLAIRAFKAIEGKGFARVDFFIRESDNKLLVNEINTIPGFTEYSMYPKLWAASGLRYSELIDKLIELALKK